MSTKDQVAAMASGIKSSAVELFKGLETSFQNREQFELALARLFSSCTGDFQAGEHDIPHRNSTLSYGENGTSERNTLGAAPLQREGSSNASSSRRPKSGSRNSSSRHSKKHGDAGKNNSAHNRSSVSPSQRERRQTRTDYGEHIYAQLFMDDQKRAAQTVSALRETAGGRAAPAAGGPSPATPSPLFPASSPPRRTKVTPLASDDLHIPQTRTFDDSISAISQHTLEAMDERIKQVKSTDSSLWSSLKETKTPPLAPPRHHRPLSPPPIMPRVRSAQSNAASSRRSRASQTTHTSESSDFQKVWQQDEQKYWHTQVEQDSRKSRKSRNSTTQKTLDHTLPTMESSMDDVWASPLRPDAGPLARDPDRIGAVFVVPSTDLAEI